VACLDKPANLVGENLGEGIFGLLLTTLGCFQVLRGFLARGINKALFLGLLG